MKVVFYYSDKPREVMLSQAICEGVELSGDEFEGRRTADYGEDCRYEGPTPDTDVAICFGVKGKSREIMRDHLAVGKPVIYLDKGYIRDKGEGGHTLYTRVSINSSDPTGYFMRKKRSSDRWDLLGMELKERKKSIDGHVLFCGSSEKYHTFHGLAPAQEYAEMVIYRLRKNTDRPIVYRPKPSWEGAKPINGALYSTKECDLSDALRGCYCLVTHGSGAAIFAIAAGIPAIVFGNGLAKPVAEKEWANVDSPFWAKESERKEWANALSYCQWTNDEMRNGMMWQYVREELENL